MAKAVFPEIKDWSSLTIRLERWGCYGTCAVYKVEIRGDGSVNYDGVDNVVVTGKHHNRISQAALRDLVAQFRKADFFALDDEYSPGAAARKIGANAIVNDAPTYIVSIAFGGRSKKIEDTLGSESGMPKVVSELQNAVDLTAGTERWVEGSADTIPSLEAEGWDFHVPARKHSFLLVRAAQKGNAALVRQLLEAGVSARDAYGCAALYSAADIGDGESVDVLAQAGAPVDAGEVDVGEFWHVDCRPLMAAVEHGSPKIVARILSLHPVVDARDEHGRTALMSSRDPVVARLLLEAGADVHARDDEGRTPLMMESGNPETVRVLLAAGAVADVNLQDSRGSTALMGSYDPAVTQVLLEAGADPALTDKDGKTALDQVGNWRQTAPVLQAWMAAHRKK